MFFNDELEHVECLKINICKICSGMVLCLDNFTYIITLQILMFHQSFDYHQLYHMLTQK